MATLYYDANGAILQLVRDVDCPVPSPPVGASSFTFDETANPTLAASINAAWNRHCVVAGALCCDGTTVNVATMNPAEVRKAKIAKLRNGRFAHHELQLLIADILEGKWS